MHDPFHVHLDVPEHGQLRLPLAGLGARALAALIDVSLIAVALLGLTLVLVVGAATGLISADLGMPIAIATAALAPALGPLLLEILMAGRSPGKRFLHLRVIASDGAPVSPTQLLLRNVLRLVDFLPVGYLIGIIAAFSSERTQRLGDLVAGTLVIREGAELRTAPRDASIAVPKELRGVPAAVIQAAQLLADPSRPLPQTVAQHRRAELVALVRRHRPDLAQASDEELWRQLQSASEP